MLAAMGMGFDSIGMQQPMNPYMMYMTGMAPIMPRPYSVYATNVMMPGMGQIPNIAAMNAGNTGMNSGMGQQMAGAQNPFDY